MGTLKFQTSLCIGSVSPEPSLSSLLEGSLGSKPETVVLLISHRTHTSFRNIDTTRHPLA